MLFSVVIPTYNRARLLRDALESVFAQTFTDYEVIVVDDGSTDDTQEIVKAYGERLKFYRQENAGPGAARNLGVSRARGHYVAFLDSDDLWFPWTLQSYADALRQCGEGSMLRASCIEFVEDPPLLREQPESVRAIRYKDYFEAGGRGVFVGAGQLALQRTQFLLHEGFDPRLHCGEEHDLALKLGQAVGFIEISAPCQMAYRRHAMSSTHDLAKTIHGVRTIIEREKAGDYPGGDDRRFEREGIITLMARPVSLACLYARRLRDAWALYRSIWPWCLEQRRWKYLLAFPILAVWHWLVPHAARHSCRTV